MREIKGRKEKKNNKVLEVTIYLCSEKMCVFVKMHGGGHSCN